MRRVGDGARETERGETMAIPKTSTTMLKQIAGMAEHPRWAEFVAKYRPMLEGRLAEGGGEE